MTGNFDSLELKHIPLLKVLICEEDAFGAQLCGGIFQISFLISKYPYFALYRGSCSNKNGKHCNREFESFASKRPENVWQVDSIVLFARLLG